MISIAHVLAAAMVLQSPGSASQIVIDAEFNDWANVPAAIVDPEDAPHAFVDFGEVRVHHDVRFVHLLIDFGRTVNIQGLDGMAMILMDADGNPKTGRAQHGLDGVDVIVDLTPPHAKSHGKTGVGIGLRSTTYSPNPDEPAAKKLTPYDIGMVFAPTHAGRRMEFRFERGAHVPQSPPLFSADRFTGKLVFIDLAGKLADETEAFTGALTETVKAAADSSDQSNDPLAHTDHTDLRVLSWNVHDGAIFTQSELFIRTLAALKPDVLVLQELTDDNSGEQLRSFLEKALPPSEGYHWNVLFGAGGGDLRCAIASTHALRDPLPLIAMPGRADQSIRAAGALAAHGGRQILIVSVHLKCCGRAGGPEDLQRQSEAQLINETINTALNHSGFEAAIVAGDFNLVGSRDPLELLAAGLDADHSAMTVVEARQLDGLSNTTWADPNQPFVPGRLDYMLFADSKLEIRRSFIYDSRDLSPHWLNHHGVQAGDTPAASDHMPLVADFRWKAPNR